MDELHRIFDLTVLLNSEDNKAIKELLEKHGSIIIESRPVTKLSLAYPIRKQTSAYLAVFVFSIRPDLLLALERDLKMETCVLRYLILRTELKRKKEAAFPPSLSREQAKTKESFLTNEALEKKIEEILK